MQTLHSSGDVASGMPAPATRSESLFQQAREGMASLPLASSRLSLTLADALTRAQQLAEDKRKRELVREKQKQKSHVAVHDHLHGAVPGADEDKSAYWMFVEVRWIAELRLWLFDHRTLARYYSPNTDLCSDS